MGLGLGLFFLEYFLDDLVDVIGVDSIGDLKDDVVIVLLPQFGLTHQFLGLLSGGLENEQLNRVDFEKKLTLFLDYLVHFFLFEAEVITEAIYLLP